MIGRQAWGRSPTATAFLRALLLLCLPWLAGAALFGTALTGAALADPALPATVAKIKPSIVAIGTFMALRATQKQPQGTGFVVGGGNYAVTNAHVVARALDEGRRETWAVYLPGEGSRVQMRQARIVAQDPDHDLALLRFDGAALPSMTLATGGVREGQAVAFTGYPILTTLGLYPATHRALIAAIAPVAIPVASGKQLNPEMIRRLSAPFDIYQLDAVAYPGNSGSPLYETGSGRVIGVINSVFVKGTRESAISAPSGISYAIPVTHVRALLGKAGVRP